MRRGFRLISSPQETFNLAIESSLKGLSVKIFIPHDFGTLAIHLYDSAIQRRFGLTSRQLSQFALWRMKLNASVAAGLKQYA